MKTRKIRLDFSAHASVVVEVKDDSNAELNAERIALRELQENYINPLWELDDEGMEDLEGEEFETTIPVNDIEDEYD